MAKFLIVNHAMGAEGMASIVDRVNGCGGPMNEAAAARGGCQRAPT